MGSKVLRNSVLCTQISIETLVKVVEKNNQMKLKYAILGEGIVLTFEQKETPNIVT